MTMFGKITGETLFSDSSSIRQGAVVAVVSFVGTGHCAAVSPLSKEDPERLTDGAMKW